MWHCVGTTARFQRTAEFVGSSHQQVTRLQFTISTSSAREMGRPSTVSPNAGQTCRNHLQAILGRQQSRSVSRPCRCACVSDNSKRGDQNGESSLGGSSNVQDALVDVVRLGIGKKKALEQLSDAVDDEKLKLIQKTDQCVQAKDELDALQELNKARRNLAFGSAQADIDEKFRQMSSELKASREQMEADQQDLAAFKDKVQLDQQSGLWFKKLYSQPGKLPKIDYDNEHVKALSDATMVAMKRRSRKASFIFVSFVSFGGFLVEQAAGRPLQSWQALTLIAMAALCGFTAFHESRLDSEVLTDAPREKAQSDKTEQ